MATHHMTTTQKNAALKAFMRVVQHNRSWAELARGLSRIGPTAIDRQGVWNWYHRDRYIPAEWVHSVVELSGGLVAKEELRPDVYRPQDAADGG